MATIRTLIRRALERTRAIGVGDYISDDDANNSLYELNLLVTNSSILDKSLFNFREIYVLNNNGSASISIGSVVGADVATTKTPFDIESLQYQSAGDTFWTVLDKRTMQQDGIIGTMSTTGSPEYYIYAAPTSSTAPGLVTLYPSPEEAYNYRFTITREDTNLLLDDEWPLGSVYEEYFLYQLAASLSPSLGTDPTQLQLRANKLLTQIKRVTIKNIPAIDVEGDYSIRTNDFTKTGWGY